MSHAIQLTVHPTALPAVVFALQRTRDDLAARAIVAEQHDPDLGARSAAEYRKDIEHLADLLRQLGMPAHAPQLDDIAVTWLHEHYAIVDHVPVPLALDRSHGSGASR